MGPEPGPDKPEEEEKKSEDTSTSTNDGNPNPEPGPDKPEEEEKKNEDTSTSTNDGNPNPEPGPDKPEDESFLCCQGRVEEKGEKCLDGNPIKCTYCGGTHIGKKRCQKDKPKDSSKPKENSGFCCKPAGLPTFSKRTGANGCDTQETRVDVRCCDSKQRPRLAKGTCEQRFEDKLKDSSNSKGTQDKDKLKDSSNSKGTQDKGKTEDSKSKGTEKKDESFLCCKT